MVSGTNFDPDILEEACNDLIRLNSIITASTSLRRMPEASSIMTDITGLDDSKGGWSYLATQVSDVGTTVSQYVQSLQATAEQVHTAMRSSIDRLTGADTSSSTTINQSAPAGRG